MAGGHSREDAFYAGRQSGMYRAAFFQYMAFDCGRFLLVLGGCLVGDLNSRARRLPCSVLYSPAVYLMFTYFRRAWLCWSEPDWRGRFQPGNSLATCYPRRCGSFYLGRFL